MLQDAGSTQSAAPPADAAAAVSAAPAGAPVAGHGDAAALTHMGFADLVHHFDWLSWITLIVLIVMSIGSWLFIVINGWRVFAIRSRADRVRHVFWDTSSAQEAVLPERCRHGIDEGHSGLEPQDDRAATPLDDHGALGERLAGLTDEGRATAHGLAAGPSRPRASSSSRTMRLGTLP